MSIENQKYEDIGKRIDEVRKAQKLLIKDFAECIGINRYNVGRIIHGKQNPSKPVIVAICSKFKVNEKWLKYGTGEMYTEDSLREFQSIFDSFSKVDEPLKSVVIDFLNALDKLLNYFNNKNWIPYKKKNLDSSRF